MNIAAIIAEYNPFHNGHAYHIQKTRENGATHVVVVMSGNLVQRGDFALLDKFTRADAAVAGGADLVLELPAAYSCAAANRFAEGAVGLITRLGCVDTLSFGCECDDLSLLRRAVEASNSPNTHSGIQYRLKKGMRYPAAVVAVARAANRDVAGVFEGPNNMLAIEYINALARRNSNISIMPIKRVGAAHDSGETCGGFAGASYIRALINSGGDPYEYLPSHVMRELKRCEDAKRISGGMKAVETAVLYRLRTMSDAEYRRIPHTEDGLADRIAAASGAPDLESLYEDAATKRYTAARVRRAVMAAFFGITYDDYCEAPYARVLASNERGISILKKINPALPCSPSLKRLEKTGASAERQARLEQRVAAVFALTCGDASYTQSELTTKFGVATTADM